MALGAHLAFAFLGAHLVHVLKRSLERGHAKEDAHRALAQRIIVMISFAQLGSRHRVDAGVSCEQGRRAATRRGRRDLRLVEGAGLLEHRTADHG